MRLILVILVFLPALICAKPLEDDEIFVDVEKIDHHPESSAPRQGQKEENNEGEDCGDYYKELEGCKGIVGCSMYRCDEGARGQAACLKTVRLKYRTCWEKQIKEYRKKKEMKKE